MSERLEEINDKLETLNKALLDANSDNLKKEIAKEIDALALEGIKEVKKHLEEWRDEISEREELLNDIIDEKEEEEGHLNISISKSGEFSIDTNGFSYVEILGLLEVVKQKFINDNN